MVMDKNSAVCFATMHALYPSYNIDKKWSEEKILYLYESDIQMVSFFDSKSILFLLYPKYKERTIKIIEKCFESEDPQLVEIGGHTICEFYIHFKEFKKIVLSVEAKSENQIKSILEMAILYLGISKYKEIAQKIILTYKNTDIDLQFPLFRIFNQKYIDITHDREFLKELMKSKISKKLVQKFIHYLGDNAISIIDYKDIILQLCENILQTKLEDLKQQWGLEDDISKLIISLYDEAINIDKQITDKCMELWDIMFERQLGSVRKISQKLMER